MDNEIEFKTYLENINKFLTEDNADRNKKHKRMYQIILFLSLEEIKLITDVLENYDKKYDS